MSEDSKIPPKHELSRTGLSRIKVVTQFIPVSPSAWWQGVKEGRYPKPVKLSERVTCWKNADLWAVIEGTFKPSPQICNDPAKEVQSCREG